MSLANLVSRVKADLQRETTWPFASRMWLSCIPKKVFHDFHPFWIVSSYTRGKSKMYLFQHKIDKIMDIQFNYNYQRKSMQEKEPIIVWCELKIPSLGITVGHHSASLIMLNNYPCDGIFNLHLTTIKDSYILVCCV